MGLVEVAIGSGLIDNLEFLHAERRMPTGGVANQSSSTSSSLFGGSGGAKTGSPSPRAVDSAAANGHLRTIEFLISLKWPYSKRSYDFRYENDDDSDLML